MERMSSLEHTAEMQALLLSALEWQLELGADEAIGDAPIDRAAPPAEPAFAAPSKSAAAGGPSAARRDPIVPPKRAAAPPPRPAAPDPAASARDLAAAADDIEALRAALSGFDGSALKAGARSTVFADGRPEADLMIMGEAPGKDEDAKGLPFVGRSGQLLDKMLAAIGRDRRESDPAKGAYISNVIPYRPLGNRTPDDREVQMLLPFARRHIQLARPKLLVCLGNVPAKHLMGAASGITRFRGTWTMLELGPDAAPIPAIATFHPAYLLRSPENKGAAWRDLLAVLERLEGL